MINTLAPFFNFLVGLWSCLPVAIQALFLLCVGLGIVTALVAVLFRG